MCCLMRSAAGGSWSTFAQQRPSLRRGGQGECEEVTWEQIIPACTQIADVSFPTRVHARKQMFAFIPCKMM